MDDKYLRGASISDPTKKIFDIPDAPTIGTATDVGTNRAYNNGAATVTVTADATTGGPSQGHLITSTPGSYTATDTKPILSGTSTYTVTGLQSGTAYTFSAKTTNSSGNSQSSTSTSAITATTVPQAPTAGTPTNATGQAYSGSASVSVPFTAGASGGKTITGYTITSSSTATATGNSSPISITESNLGTANTYTVTATNANGTSVASSSSSSVVPSTVPQAPTIGSATDGGTGTTVSVPFSANATGGSSITGYSVVSNPTTTTQSASVSPYTFTGLTAGTPYTFQVAAINANGTSSYSSASNSVTPAVPSNFFIISQQAVSAVSTVTFSSIPSTYKSLQLRFSATETGSNAWRVNLNGDSGNNYTVHYLAGNGSSASSNGWATGTYSFIPFGASAGPQSSSYPGVGVMDIVDYASTSKYKTIKSLYGINYNGAPTNGQIELDSTLWTSTSAVSSLTFAVPAGTLTGTVSLYGVS